MPGLGDRADRSPADMFLPRGRNWGSPVLSTGDNVAPGCQRGSPASVRDPAFSAVGCMRLQSALGGLGPDGVPSHTTDPFVGSQLRS